MDPAELQFPSLLIVLLPLAGWLILWLRGPSIGKKTVISIALSVIAGSFLLSLITSFAIWKIPDPVTFKYANWITAGSLTVPLGLHIDNLALIMAIAITAVSLLILVYSIYYLSKESTNQRFYALVCFTTGSMILIVLAGNFLLMLIGWTSVTIGSAMLVGYDFRNANSHPAVRAVFIQNIVADTALLAAIILLAASPLASAPDGLSISLDYTTIFPRIRTLIETDPAHITGMLPILNAIAFLIFIGAAGKSAQLFFNIWLPGTTNAPAPASALIQSVSMIAAGVYLLLRAHSLLLLSPVVMAIIAVLGGVTIIYAALVASVQTDIRRILAWSTISQVGYMFLGCGTGAFIAVLFHLLTHAVTKTCLVLGAGSIVQGTGGISDLRKLGGLKKWMPRTRLPFLLAAASLAGFPLTAMFISYSAILQHSFILPFAFGWNLLAGFLGYFGIVLTAFYIFRLFYKAFEGEYRGPSDSEPTECSSSISSILWILAGLSIAGGIFAIPVPGLNFIRSSLSPIFSSDIGYGLDFWNLNSIQVLPWIFMAVTFLLFYSGYGTARNAYLIRPDSEKETKIRYKRARLFLWEELRIAEAYEAIFVKPGSWLASWLWKLVDEEFIDRGIVEGTSKAQDIIGKWFSSLRNNYVRIYALYIIIAITLLVWLLSI